MIRTTGRQREHAEGWPEADMSPCVQYVRVISATSVFVCVSVCVCVCARACVCVRVCDVYIGVYRKDLWDEQRRGKCHCTSFTWLDADRLLHPYIQYSRVHEHSHLPSSPLHELSLPFLCLLVEQGENCELSMQNRLLEKNQVWCGLVSLLPSKSDKIMWDSPGESFPFLFPSVWPAGDLWWLVRTHPVEQVAAIAAHCGTMTLIDSPDDCTLHGFL